ncbi:ABC transporter ATP-binding protein [Streptomyces sp. HUAS TT20]|uniref:ABC transporter ATP-binding protein n=1 Tax=Streptomyces sp. HUAS TT20 TaxID=3447509 RepID=UPI0021DB7883|nr:ABC transporter ATP-binding protein [Streptomyces sp. HUAS 15-9]UXY26374.1 ABC transporter ATP-binding protein [Streptomyces sp. HUAS 15-9]
MTVETTASVTTSDSGPEQGEPAGVEFRDLRRTFGSTTALDGLDLQVRPGELLALLGPSGCGKTTALRVLAGFERPDSGQVLVDGHDVVPVPANRRGAGMVFQSYSLFPHLNALDNVAFGLRMRKVPTARRRARAAELLELVGLADRADRYPRQLSGGQQQRIALARALALRPRVLLLDEPLSALDAKVRLTLREEIRRLQLELGITTLLVTHDQEEALSIADRVAVMRAGRVEQCSTPTELYARPATAFIAEFVGTVSRLPGRMTATDTVEVLGRRVPVLGEGSSSGNQVDVLVRPEAIEIVPGPEAGSRVTASSFLGAITRVTVRLPDGCEVKADVPTRRAADFSVGASASVTLSGEPVTVVERAA